MAALPASKHELGYIDSYIDKYIAITMAMTAGWIKCQQYRLEGLSVDSKPM